MGRFDCKPLQVRLQLLERAALAHYVTGEVTLRLLERDDLSHFSWNVIGWRERPKLYKLRRMAAGSH